jgi:3-(3-hydroxy-phenyl)propionate hydroxylase
LRNKDPVIVVGGGPVGSAAALFLCAADIPVLILERSGEIYDDPRAATYHPPTLELFAASGITDELHRRGLIANRWQFRDRNEGIIAEFDLGILAADTPFPYRLQCEQHKLVEMLQEKLNRYDNYTLRRNVTVEDVEMNDDGVVVTGLADGNRQQIRGSFVIGADGGRSAVRKSLAIGFEGFTYPERFLVITTRHDYEPLGFSFSNYVADPDEWCAIFKVPGDSTSALWRLAFPTDEGDDETDLLDFTKAEERLQRLIPMSTPYPIVHTNLYPVHQRVATCYRVGRGMLAGDAAHINNPLGGMGLNFGIHDAANLSEKLARIWHQGADLDLLDLYDRQRRTVAEDYLQTMTIQNKKSLEEKSPEARAKGMAEMKAIAADPARSRQHLLNTSMIKSFRAAAEIT